MIGQQDDGGGWAWEVKGSRPEADLTGAAIQALNAAGRTDAEAVEAERKGFDYLREMQNPDGGFPEFAGEPESNVASTAWAVQGIWSAGLNPEDWLKGGHEPLDYMASLQQADGHIRWKARQDQFGVWMTAYVAPAFAGQAWPIPRAPRSAPAPAPPASPGQGEGSGSRRRSYRRRRRAMGPRLFSQPKPQSKGRTPGGVRIVHDQDGDPRDHATTRRSSDPAAPGATAAAEPEHDQASTASAAAAGGGAGGADGAAARPGGAGSAGGSGGGSALTSSGAGSEEPSSGREVTGTVVGTNAGVPARGALAFGAPGLHSAGVDLGGTSWLAIAIAAAALAFGLAGVRMERRSGASFS